MTEIVPMIPEQEPGYVVIRQEDAQVFSAQVSQLAAALMALQQEVDMLRRENSQRATINHQQAKGLAAQIRQRAEAICEKYDLPPAIHGAAFRAAIKKAALQSCGVQDLHDIPLRELETVEQRIANWSSYALVRKRRYSAAAPAGTCAREQAQQEGEVARAAIGAARAEYE